MYKSERKLIRIISSVIVRGQFNYFKHNFPIFKLN